MNLLLAKILLEKDLEVFSKLKAQYFTSPYNRIYIIIQKFYEKYGHLPSFEELEVTVRDKQAAASISALKHLDVPDVSIDVLYEALIDEFTQTRTLEGIEKIVDRITIKDTVEIVEDLNNLALQIEEETDSTDSIILMNDYSTIDENELLNRVPLGISNDFDQFSLGGAMSEFYMFGGFRGSGKSLICSNIACNQYELGNSSLYFSIEMRGREIYERNLAILSGVPAKHIKSGKLTEEDKLRIARVRAGMTVDGGHDLLKKYENTKDFKEFEIEIRQRPLNPKSQIITVDNPSLTLSYIDATIAKFKSRLKENLTVVVVDYINQIAERDAYKWDVQIQIAKKLKEFARKHEVLMITPYQTDEEGKTRFSKGILIPPDWAFITTAKKMSDGESRDSISFECTKARNDGSFHFESGIDWPTLKINPTHNYFQDKSSVGNVTTIGKKKQEKTYEKLSDDL
jgi:replicative DNA helicase